MSPPTRRGRGSRTPTSETITSTVYQVHRTPRLAEDADKLLDEAGQRLRAIDQAVDLAIFDNSIDVEFGAFVLDMTCKVRRFVEAATHRDLVGVS